MNRFNPTSRSIHPPFEEDDLGTALVTALRRNIGDQLTWDWPIVLALGLLTAGLLPLIMLILRFQRFATAQIFQLEHLAAWYSSRGQTNDELEKATRQLQLSRWSWRAGVIGVIGVAIACVIVIILHFRQTGFSPQSLFALWTLYLPGGHGLLYSVLLAIGYMLCWFTLREFAGQMQRFAHRVNEVFVEEGAQPIQPPLRAAWPAAVWNAVGLALLIPGCLWGLPMMLAAGAHRRYINQISQTIRMQMAERVETLIQRENVPV